jgi:hypothetical protein
MSQWNRKGRTRRAALANRTQVESLARSYTKSAIRTVAGIMLEESCPPMARVAAAKVLLDRRLGQAKGNASQRG